MSTTSRRPRFVTAGLVSRRMLLAGTAAAALTSRAAAREVSGALPWAPNAADPPIPARPGPWLFFTPEEGVLVEAIADRLIPPDPAGTANPTPGGKDAGCAVFIDRQLAGPYGRSAGLYMRPPFMEGTKEQGPQSPLTPAERYRQGLGALDRHVRAANAGRGFHEIPATARDALLTSLQLGHVRLDGANGQMLFTTLLTDVKQGFLTDPVYGGNIGMAGWRMIGFPGARYDYSDWVTRHNERYPLPPVGIGGRPEWERSPQSGKGL